MTNRIMRSCLSLILMLAAILVVFAPEIVADEKSDQSGIDILKRAQALLANLTSLSYSETLGSVPDDFYTQTTWQEMGNLFHLNFTSVQGPLRKYEVDTSYDGNNGYNYIQVINRLYVQKKPFSAIAESHSASLRGPLMPFEFCESRDVGRLKLETLKSPDMLTRLASRATLDPEKNRVWFGHQCVAVKITDGYDRWDQIPVDFIVYFAPDLGFFPVAWEMYDSKGNLVLCYWVQKFKNVTIDGSGVKLLIPELIKFRNSTTVRNNYKLSPNSPHDEIPFIRGADEDISWPDLKINDLSKDDFALDPSMASTLYDLDAKKMIIIPK